ncbi:hypothetical protein [Anaerobutyricum hallii]|uniref:hypothetical protein n=1 Tax=Anaerobutyricum hallii TaxID=39488 RepID=UPI0039A2BAE5
MDWKLTKNRPWRSSIWETGLYPNEAERRDCGSANVNQQRDKVNANLELAGSQTMSGQMKGYPVTEEKIEQKEKEFKENFIPILTG